MKDLSKVSLSIGSLQAHYSSGCLTPGDVIREVYRRIRTLPNNPVWIHLVPEEEALQATEALHGTAAHSLFGIPFAIKDNIDLAGVPTTAGCPEFACCTASADRMRIVLIHSSSSVCVSVTAT